MDNAKCYNCHAQNAAFYAKENGYTLVKCSSCGLIYVSNPPKLETILQAHKQGDHSGDKKFNITGRFKPELIQHYRELLPELFAEGLETKRTWLDVGCGHGEFMLALQASAASAFRVRGSEPNIYKQTSAQKRGLDVRFYNLDQHEEKYDVISLLNVYSHLPDPHTFLESLKKLLNPGGELLLETGDTAGLEAKDHYRPFYLPDHLSFASESIMVGMLERHGFEVVTIRKYPFVHLTAKNIIKELVKIILPGYRSNINYYLHKKYYQRTDMFIRARLAN